MAGLQSGSDGPECERDGSLSGLGSSLTKAALSLRFASLVCDAFL